MTEQTQDFPIPLEKLRKYISIGALFLALLHLLWPSLSIDAITLILIIIAILPWVAPLIKSFELPGGWKVEFQDLQDASSRAETAGLLAQRSSEEEQFSFQTIAKQDPNLALAGLRIEIEKRLMLLATSKSVTQKNRPMGIGQLLRVLTNEKVLTHEERAILADMINLLNGAVHGANVDERSADWAIDIGPRLLTSLDERIKEVKEEQDV
jgi:hypothetical protein